MPKKIEFYVPDTQVGNYGPAGTAFIAACTPFPFLSVGDVDNGLWNPVEGYLWGHSDSGMAASDILKWVRVNDPTVKVTFGEQEVAFSVGKNQVLVRRDEADGISITVNLASEDAEEKEQAILAAVTTEGISYMLEESKAA